MALVKYNNNSISAITTAGTLATGAMVLIKEQTASSSSTISFVDGSSDVDLDATYPIYKFEFINIHPEENSKFLTFQASNDTGSSYGVTATTSFFRAQQTEAGSDATLAYDTSMDFAQSTSFLYIGRPILNDNDASLSGSLIIYNPSSTTFVKHFMARFPYMDSRSPQYIYDCFTSGYFNTTSAIDAIQFKYATDEIQGGSIKMYGIA